MSRRPRQNNKQPQTANKKTRLCGLTTRHTKTCLVFKFMRT